jgi:hypothetical protein
MRCGRIPNEDEPIIRRHLAKFDKLFPALALKGARRRIAIAAALGAIERVLRAWVQAL